MKATELRVIAAHLDALRDIMVELVAALPPDRAARFAAALTDRLAARMGRREIDERTDTALVSDLAPLFAALQTASAVDKAPTHSASLWMASARSVPLTTASRTLPSA